MKKRTYDKAFYQKLWGLMIPIVLQNLMLALVAVADAFMLGGMNQNYMSAVSLATQIQFIQNMFLAAATASLGILGAQYWGKGDIKTLDEIFCMALRLCGLVSVVFFAACVFAGKYLMLIFTNESVLIEHGVSYLRIAGFSYLLTGISQCYLIIMKVSEHAKTTAAVSSATVCINIVLNAVFIYGAFGIPSMGVRGAALATLISRCIELAVSVIISYRKGYIHPQMKFLFYRNKQLSRDFYKCGIGAGNLEQGKKYGIRLMKISCVCGIAVALLMCLAAPVILHFVKLTPEASGYLKGMFGVIAFYMIGRAINDVTINGIFGAGGDTLFDMYSLAVCMWCIAIPLAAAGTYYFHWPVVVVYACTCVDEVGKLPWVLHHFRKYKWVKDLTH